MKVDYDISLLKNESLIDMYIEPNPERFEDEFLNLTRLNFTKEVLSFEDR